MNGTDLCFYLERLSDFFLSNQLSRHPLIMYIPPTVGAGSAGSAVAARLSEVPEWRVLLLEAGGEPPPESHVPGLFGTLLQGDTDWKFKTTRQKYSLRGFKDQVKKSYLAVVLNR